MLCSFGTYRAPNVTATVGARVYSVATDVSGERNKIFGLATSGGTSYEIVGPLAYNRATRSLYVFVAIRSTPTDPINNPFVIYRVTLQDKTSVPLSNSVFYTHSQAGAGTIRSSFAGASIRLDTNTLLAADDTFKRMYVFPLQGLTSTTGPAYNTTYSASYSDVEFIGSAGKPSKLFFAVLQDASILNAELYVQCAPCRDGGVTFTNKPAESAAECMCQPGYYVTADGGCRCFLHVLDGEAENLI